MKQTITTPRIISLTFSTKGVGYAVMEGERSFVAYGVKDADGDKNVQSFIKVEKLIDRYKPDVLVLQDVNATDFHRAKRIKPLQKQIVMLARKRNINVATLSGTHVRTVLLDDPKGTKYDIAVVLANQFSDELALRLPPKRRLWESEHKNMDMFDAVGLAMAFWLDKKRDQ